MLRFIIPLLIFSVSITLALYNIGNFPKMIGDEGIYVSQAYWLAEYGQLGPYTYWYDHFPLGWAQIALWQTIVGPLGILGYSVLSSRIFMAIFLAGSSVVIYLITKHLTQSKLSALLASLIFSTSLLTLTFGRMVLLDNMAIFWFLLSFLTLLKNPHKLKHLFFSSLFLSIAILTKETLLFLLPPYLYAVYRQNQNNPHKNYGLLLNFTTIIFLLSFFPLLAMLKGEFLAHPNQVSFLETILFQASRGSGIAFWQAGSHFREMLSVWLTIDPILLLLGTGSILLIPILKLSYLKKLTTYFLIFFIFFLIRGGQIYEFYIIPAIPLFAINIAVLINYFNKISRSQVLPYLLLLAIGFYVYSQSFYPFTSQATKPQKDSIDELIALPADSAIVANNYAFLDVTLRSNNLIHWYQKIESDPSIQIDVGTVTHILTDVQFEAELSSGQLPFLSSTLAGLEPNLRYGPLLAPGELPHPFSTESLNLYHATDQTPELSKIVILEEISVSNISQLIDNPPSGIMITATHFTGSLDLQTKISLIRSILPDTLILTSQDGEGHNAIPWIPTLSRSFYKSSQEAVEATRKKSLALKELGFDGAVVSTSRDEDGYLSDILKASNEIFLGLALYQNDQTPKLGSLVINHEEDSIKLKSSRFQGKIFLLESGN